MKMMCVQLSVVTAISTVLALLFEPQAFFWHHFLLFLPWMLFLAISEVRACRIVLYVTSNINAG